MGAKSERKRIRHKIVEILKSANIPGVGEDIFSQASINNDEQQLPAINVYVKSETVGREVESPKQYQRLLDVELEIQSTHDTDDLLADELDDLAQYVEDAIERGGDLFQMTHENSKEKLINDFDLISVQYDTESNGSNPTGSCRMIYRVEYYTNEEKKLILKDFDRFETQYNANENEDGTAAELSEFQNGA